MKSLVEDFKLSTCGMQPLFFYSLSFDFACPVCFCGSFVFRTSVCYSILGERSRTLHPTCATHLVLYFCHIRDNVSF
jgi:hypothetical protein